MGRWLLRLDGSFSASARLALAAIVVVSFAAGYLGHAAGDPSDGTAAPVAPGRIEADLPAPPAESGPVLTSAPALPGLAGQRRRPAPAVATATPEPTATSQPVETPTPAPTPAATPAPPPPAPPAPKPTPAGTTFDSSG